MELNNVTDKGFVILDRASNCYYCGLNTFHKQLRKAQVYHSMSYVNEAIDSLEQKDRIKRADVRVFEVSMHVVKRVQ